MYTRNIRPLRRFDYYMLGRKDSSSFISSSMSILNHYKTNVFFPNSTPFFSTSISFPSRKESLKQVPYSKYRPILSHIERIGVGIRPKQGKPKFKTKKKSAIKLKASRRHVVYSEEGHAYSNMNSNLNSISLSPKEEDAYFAGRRSRIRSSSKSKKNKKVIEHLNKDGKIYKAWGKYKPIQEDLDHSIKIKNLKTNDSHCWWMPPPPFAPSSDVLYEDRTKSGYQIKRLPVKIIGTSSVQTLEQHNEDNVVSRTNHDFYEEKENITIQRKFAFPRGSKGLPEIAIAGRSNVGKSTLLNALLYGNQMRGTHGEAPENRKYQRGKTPVFAKLPKGVKAMTSNRPGETKDITFYQLTSEITSSHKKSAKMSMLLADLPGYGFAYASKERAQEWREMMKDLIINRGKSLKRVLLLLDARHGMKTADVDFLVQLQQDLKRLENTSNNEFNSSKKKSLRRELPPIQIVLTKCDLVPQIDLARQVIQVREELSDILIREPSSLPVMLVSAKAGLGFNNIRKKQALGGILELQRELTALVPEPDMH